jgi:hypothetical protein
VDESVGVVRSVGGRDRPMRGANILSLLLSSLVPETGQASDCSCIGTRAQRLSTHSREPWSIARLEGRANARDRSPNYELPTHHHAVVDN